ncbi:sugar phosphate isomerase/epimerase and 4-hydroxyphenylpyruvate domain-containing protein [Actinomycetospora straminea]|uniref:3-dehydroshikimate dehydratase n=1 Tax=Actinomycetospora straminea TaxID=663607 RepID=A0ABP9EEK4_9PSEU|nr:sugar phosphate isomerase/epimerase and 4-hydroxyphenylpyruvate domain-containing protein [Actinomycetospora straminea]MDD7932212.1 TIM barrel protein [Actinomycetospora straminea]
MPRHALATVCLSGLLEDKLAAAAAAGFDGVEIFEPDMLASPERPAEIAARCADLGLAIELFQPVRDLEALPPDDFADALRRLDRKFAVMEQLGVTTALVCSSVHPHAVDDDDLAAEQLHVAASRAADRGLRLAYEALAWGRHVDTWDRSWRIVEAADHPALGVCLDSFHILSRGSDPAPIRDVPGEKIFFVQLADAPELAMDVLPWSRHHRLFPGQGAFDLAGFTGAVAAAGYAGPWSLEVFNDVVRQADPWRAARDARRSLLALEETVGVAGTLPPRPPVHGPAFVELAVDPDTADEIGTVLHALGLDATGRHRTKPVTLWEAGEARVVVSEEPVPTTSIAGLAVRTDDPEALARRAEALLAPRRDLPHAADEADLRAVGAPDGSLLLCCPQRPEPGRADFWPGDFVPTGVPRRPGHVAGIDHVALTPPWDDVGETSLFHRACLGLEPVGEWEVAAPFGLVRSRLLAAGTGADALRIVLSSSVVRRGGWAPGVPAPQSLALAVDDVLAVARAATAAGVRLVDVGPNHYDDLVARGWVDEETAAELRAHRVLVDRDEHGEYRHVVTEVLGGRVFVEAVQRVGGYAGHGAADAPARMAAHRRARVAGPAA